MITIHNIEERKITKPLPISITLMYLLTRTDTASYINISSKSKICMGRVIHQAHECACFRSQIADTITQASHSLQLRPREGSTKKKNQIDAFSLNINLELAFDNLKSGNSDPEELFTR